MQYLRAIFLSLLVAVPAWAGTDEAVVLYGKKDYASAFAEFSRMAELGDHQAQFNIGAMYYRGEHVTQDFVQAYAWMSLAAQKENEQWKRVSAQIYGSLNDEQKKAADQARQALFDKLADDKVAQQLAPELEGGSGTANSLRPIRKVAATYPRSMERKNESGWVDVLFTIAPDGTTRNHLVTYSTNKDFIEPTLVALKGYLYQPVTINGRAVEVYGEENSFRYMIRGVTYSEKKVKELVESERQKAEQGTSESHYRYAHFLEILPSYTDVKLENSDVNGWYMRSAQAGFGPAQFSLGKNLLYGRACTADTAKSLRWLERAARAGQPNSQYLLGIEMLSGVRLARNPEGAMNWLQRAADGNLKHAQLKLAWLYSTSVDAAHRNPALAKVYIDKVDDEYVDKLTLYETRAAVAAASGDFGKAVEWQLKTVEEAERYKLPMDGFNAKLETYKTGKPWLEAT